MNETNDGNPLIHWLTRSIPLKSVDTPPEERINTATHLLGLALALSGSVPLIMRAAEGGLPWMVFSAAAYSLSMVVLYGASSFYHYSIGEYAKRIGRILDHLAIYLLIAGTYTPVAFRIWEPEGPVMLLILWGIVIVGFLFKLFFWQRFKALHVAVYLAMGWLIVFFWEPVIERIPEDFLPWALAGGLSYSLGVIFYSMKSRRYHHAVWHLFVLAGSIFFYLGIYRHIIA
jgi:hemolysin III